LFVLHIIGRENPAAWATELGGHSWRITGDIVDNWESIVSRAEYSASLWRYAGPEKGWNDPDMLEIGNGGCSTEEYQTHFSLWSMLKAPLITGNDVRNLKIDDEIFNILGNKELIAVNQDSLGLQGRIVWSDLSNEILPQKGYGHRVTAVKCSSGVEGAYEDKISDQQWEYTTDGTIRSISTGGCLHELATGFFNDAEVTTPHFNFSKPVHAVTTADCSQATKWDLGQLVGGSIVSRSSGLCLEVNKFEELPIVQGKRIQTAPCQIPSSENNHFYVDVREHQSWTTPNQVLFNLYQRQCLTIDHDAFPGATKEVWKGPLVDGAYSLLIVNKGRHTMKFTLTTDMVGLNGGTYHVRDLWEHSDMKRSFSDKSSLTFTIKSHASVMLKATPAV
jgi:hypothetical protein